MQPERATGQARGFRGKGLASTGERSRGKPAVAALAAIVAGFLCGCAGGHASVGRVAELPAASASAAEKTQVPPLSPPSPLRTSADILCIVVHATGLYHRPGCPELRAKEGVPGAVEVCPSVLNALERGFKPCPRCAPPVVDVARADTPGESPGQAAPAGGSVLRVRGEFIAGDWFLLSGRTSWLKTGLHVRKGQILCIVADGWITCDAGSPQALAWDPDGRDQYGRATSTELAKRRNCLQARIGRRRFVVGSRYFHETGGDGPLELGFDCAGERATTVGFFRVYVGVFAPGARVIEGGEEDGAGALRRVLH